MQVYDLARARGGVRSRALHGRFLSPALSAARLDIVAQKVKRLLVFQTLTLPGRDVVETSDVALNASNGMNNRAPLTAPGWPKMAFIEHTFSGDPTNWWVANHAAVEAMLRSSGLRVIGYPGDEIYLCEPDPKHPSCVTTWNRAEYLGRDGHSLGKPLAERFGVCQWFHYEDYASVELAIELFAELGLRHLRTGISWADFYRPNGAGLV